ncbi:MAG TPA: asparagine synthase-related protein [Thermoplasmata archaeon]|nr:asparagine synthase-related protein [Thermoplasmata archaeon]
MSESDQSGGTDAFGPLDDAIEAVLTPWRSMREPLTLLLSGGVDSGLLAWELRNVPALRAITVGMDGSPDLADARASAATIGVDWVPRTLSAEDVRRARSEVEPLVAGLPPTTQRVLTAFALAVEHSPSAVTLCGQGADELFLGYAHFRGLPREELQRRADLDLATLRDRDWPLSQQIGTRLGKKVVAPYLEPAFVRAARSVPLAVLDSGGTPKGFFRRWAMHRGLPEMVALRPKRALQYGSGVDRILRPQRRERA